MAEDVQKDEIICKKCGVEHERVAPEGVVLQSSEDYICDDCQNAHNVDSGAVDAENERLAAEAEDAKDGVLDVELTDKGEL
jgi:hypothetical protein